VISTAGEPRAILPNPQTMRRVIGDHRTPHPHVSRGENGNAR
jgi:hypothetical protein